MIFYKIKAKLIIFTLVSFFLLNDTNVLATAIDSRKYFKEFIKIRDGAFNSIIDVSTLKLDEYQKNKGSTCNPSFLISFRYLKYQYNSSSTHQWVEEILTHKKFDSDSGNGTNGVLRQYHNDCVLNSMDNLFYLETIGDQVGADGKLYYTDFSRRLRNTANGTGMYIFYAFIDLFSTINNSSNFENEIISNFGHRCNTDFDIINKGKTVNGKNLNTILNDIFREFKTTHMTLYQPIASFNPTPEKEAMEFLKYFFTYMKNDEMKLVGDFDFVKDTPHLLWLFRESLGLSVKDVDDIIDDYKKNYKLPPLLPVILVPKIPTTPAIPVVPSYVSPNISPYIINEYSVKFLSDFSDVYLYIIRNVIVSEINHIGGVGNNDRKSKGFNISTGYETNKKQADGSDIKESLSVNINYRTRILKKSNSNFGIMLGFNYNLLSLENLRENFYDDEDPMKLYHITFGASYRKIYIYDNVSNFNLGFLLNWKIDNKRKYLKDNFGLSFRNKNITAFLRDNRVFNVDKLLISSIVFSSSISYTNVNIDKIETESGFDNYDINDVVYNMILLSIGLSFRKDISIGFLKNSSAIGIDFVSNLNNQKNDFSLRNKYGGEKQAIINDVEKTKNGFTISFRNGLEIAKHITVAIEISKNLDIRKDMFFKGSLNISF